jgi:hypothetical protein
LTSQNEKQWGTIARKAYLTEYFPTLQEALTGLHHFLQPPIEAIAAYERLSKVWQPDSGWSK